MVTIVMMIVLRFVQMTKANIHQFQKSIKIEDALCVLSKRYLGKDHRGEIPEESSEITKASVIDGRFSIDLPEVRPAPLRNVRATDVSEWDNLFSVQTFFLYRRSIVFCRRHVL